MTRAGIILPIAVGISLFLSLGITFPVSSNEEKENKTIRHRIQQHYSEPINFAESATRRASGDEIPEGSLEILIKCD